MAEELVSVLKKLIKIKAAKLWTIRKFDNVFLRSFHAVYKGNILKRPTDVNTAGVVDRWIDKTGVINEMSCPQVLCIRGC